MNQIQRGIMTIREEQDDRSSEEGMPAEELLVGSGSKFLEVLRLVAQASEVDAPVLVTGETGTGKSLVARAIHQGRVARGSPFVAVNCAAIPESLIEAELFGHERGSFTGAFQTRKGLFELAEGGTLFLDEIGEMPLPSQARLLGALEEKQIRRVGGESMRRVNVRAIGATSSDLESSLGRTFRRDLYYRLNVIRIHLPALRERLEDLPSLCQHLLGKIRSGRKLRLASQEPKNLRAHGWPGNIRELRNLLERAVIFQGGAELRPSEFLAQQSGARPAVLDPALQPAPLLRLEDLERRYIHYALQSMDGNYSRTSRVLGISLSTLKRKVRSYWIGTPTDRVPSFREENPILRGLLSEAHVPGHILERKVEGLERALVKGLPSPQDPSNLDGLAERIALKYKEAGWSG